MTSPAAPAASPRLTTGTEPQFAEAQFSEPQFADPQFADSQFADPQFADSQFAGTGRARHRGTRVRAGNAMGRTRSSLLEAAGRLVAQRGTRQTSMTDIAVGAGIAKGTLYNHFRNKDEVFAALVEAEVLRLADECHRLPLADALGHAALRVGNHPALRRVVADEPSCLVRLLTSGAVAAAGPGGETREAGSAAQAGSLREPASLDTATVDVAVTSEGTEPGATFGAGSTEELGSIEDLGSTELSRSADVSAAVSGVGSDGPIPAAGRAAGWRAARRATADLLLDAGRDPASAELVVRWLLSHAATPDGADAIDSARLLAGVLPPA